MRRGVVAILVMGLMMWAGGSAAQDRGIEVRLKASEAVGAPDAGAVRLYNTSYALVIGIDAYSGGWPRLSNAVADARAVAAALEGKGFEVTLKTDLDRVGLESALQEFFVVKGDDPAARLFVWFAGHGHSDGGEGYLVPRDAPRPQVGAQFKLKALSMLRIGEYVRQARSKHVFAVFDSCFAGTVFDGQRALPPAAITRSTTLPVRQFLTSGDADQTVSDDGTFRELFLRALNGEENADANGDGYLTAGELSMFLSDRVTNLTRTRQTPRWGKLRHKDFDRGDFVFALPAAARISTPVQPMPDADAMTCRALQNSTNVAAFQEYLRSFPNGQCAGFARVQVANLKAPVNAELKEASHVSSRMAALIQIVDDVEKFINTVYYKDNKSEFDSYMNRSVGSMQERADLYFKLCRERRDCDFNKISKIPMRVEKISTKCHEVIRSNGGDDASYVAGRPCKQMERFATDMSLRIKYGE